MIWGSSLSSNCLLHWETSVPVKSLQINRLEEARVIGQIQNISFSLEVSHSGKGLNVKIAQQLLLAYCANGFERKNNEKKTKTSWKRIEFHRENRSSLMTTFRVDQQFHTTVVPSCLWKQSIPMHCIPIAVISVEISSYFSKRGVMKFSHHIIMEQWFI